MRRAEQFAVEPVSPAVDRAHDAVARIAAAFEHDGLAMAADIAEQLDPARVAHQRLRVVETLERMKVADRGDQQFMADVARAPREQQALLERVNLRIEVPLNRKLRGSATERWLAGQV